MSRSEKMLDEKPTERKQILTTFYYVHTTGSTSMTGAKDARRARNYWARVRASEHLYL
jgi:hypothetical protein